MNRRISFKDSGPGSFREVPTFGIRCGPFGGSPDDNVDAGSGIPSTGEVMTLETIQSYAHDS